MRHKIHPLVIALFFVFATVGLQACFEEHSGPGYGYGGYPASPAYGYAPFYPLSSAPGYANGYRNGEQHEEHEEHAEHPQHEEERALHEEHAEHQGQAHPHGGNAHD